MWFGILTPGAHPSRPTPIAEATVFAWTPDDRRRIDGPLGAVHGGLRVVRRSFYDGGLVPSPPRCFVCLRASPVPEPGDVHALADVPDLSTPRVLAVPREIDTALLAFAHLADLDGPDDTPLDEAVLVVDPGSRQVVSTVLERLPATLAVLALADPDPPSASCTRCGTVLPGSDAQRRAKEAGGSRRQRRSHQRRAA